MRVSGKMFLAIGVFLVIAAGLYAFWTAASTRDGLEWTGFTALFVSVLFAFMMWFLMVRTDRQMGPAPEDDLEGEVDQIQGEYGFFTPHSWWPLALAGSAAFLFLGVAVGWWIFAIGAFIGVPALLGWTFEHYKGQHAN